MKTAIWLLFAAFCCLASNRSNAQEAGIHTWRDIKYSDQSTDRNVLDIYTAEMPVDQEASLPVVFWIHGGGWQTGDKSDVQLKPSFFTSKGYVFVSTNYRLLPEVTMEIIISDVAEALAWTHKNIAEYGGDPRRMFVMGHSAGAQLAAILCTDLHYLQSLEVPAEHILGCVPVDGDTFDIPAIIETAEVRRRVHGLPQATFGHREKFGNDEAKHQNFSAVFHIEIGKKLPPFLVLHVADHPDTTAQAQRLVNKLSEAKIPATAVACKETTHRKINHNLGLEGDQATEALLAFMRR